MNGAANRSLVALLADRLGVPKSRIAIVMGDTGRDKVVRLEGIDGEKLRELLDKI
ncbi:MAG TPA: DUF167 domain-containing protein [Chthonomonadaceae bacterium]|nr:DUF167 domain-containing protein [Chthonomonadaceae bacterium]